MFYHLYIDTLIGARYYVLLTSSEIHSFGYLSSYYLMQYISF